MMPSQHVSPHYRTRMHDPRYSLIVKAPREPEAVRDLKPITDHRLLPCDRDAFMGMYVGYQCAYDHGARTLRYLGPELGPWPLDGAEAVVKCACGHVVAKWTRISRRWHVVAT